jgi:protein-S-isoprenylcysteine O-methyltransferase Ste14
VGVILGMLLAAPLMLGSGWALLPAALSSGVLVVRTALEDRFLHRHLDGYAAYAARVRYRLAPGLW